jgi:hypothetical protein
MGIPIQAGDEPGTEPCAVQGRTCRGMTTNWTALPTRGSEGQVACCRACSEAYGPEDVPTKAEWYGQYGGPRVPLAMKPDSELSFDEWWRLGRGVEPGSGRPWGDLDHELNRAESELRAARERVQRLRREREDRVAWSRDRRLALQAWRAGRRSEVAE